MTACNTKTIQFSRVKWRQVTANFNGGRLTTDADILLLREVDRQIGLIDTINDCLPDPRDPRYIIHEQREMLAQRIFSIALGYEDLNNQQTLLDDLIRKKLIERRLTLPRTRRPHRLRHTMPRSPRRHRQGLAAPEQESSQVAYIWTGRAIRRAYRSWPQDPK